MASQKLLALVGGRQTEVEVAAGGSVPVLVEPGIVYMVPRNTQVLFTEPIDMGPDAEISFEENGVLTEVS